MIVFCRFTLFTFPKMMIGLFFVAYFFAPSFSHAKNIDRGNRVLRIAAASNLRFSMDEIATAFEQEQGIGLEISYGASGNLLMQIIAGAPFDLFFSADEALPLRLIKEGLADGDTYFLYGRGRIVLWVLRDSPIDLEALKMDALLHHRVNKIAIANPRHAPYGIAAIATLKGLNLWKRLEKKLVIGENISHAATFVRQGHAEIGILSYALALSEPLRKSGRYWLIPSDSHPTLNQGGLILARSNEQSAAKSLLHFIRSGEGLNILKKYGFITGEALR